MRAAGEIDEQAVLRMFEDMTGRRPTTKEITELQRELKERQEGESTAVAKNRRG
jgi:hypothetical protein